MVIKMNMILLMMTVMTVGSLRDDDDDDDDGSESFPGLTKLTVRRFKLYRLYLDRLISNAGDFSEDFIQDQNENGKFVVVCSGPP